MVAQVRANAFDDPSVPHPARRYNYWLGGREHYKVDRAAGDAVAAAMPTIRLGVRENRAFLRRVVRFMADAGIRQFIDVGPGIPAPDCTHEVAQAIAPETRVVYVDNDPLVIAYSRALLRGDAIPEGFAVDATADGEVFRRGGLIGHVLADLCDPELILEDVETRTVIDFSEPVGLLLVAVAHFCTDDAVLFPAVSRLVDALPSGSMVALSHAVSDYVDPRIVTRVDTANADHKAAFRWRQVVECEKFADGLEFVEPGLVPVQTWRAEQEPEPRPVSADVGICAWLARKP